MKSTQGISERARFLRNAAPREFDEFVLAFAQYTSAARDNLVQTTVNLQVVQGHAQQCAALLGVLEEVKKNG